MTQVRSAPRFTLTGWHVLAMLLLFFGADIAVNSIFMSIAYRSYPGEGSETPYEDGLIYNTALKQRREQAGLGWRLAAAARAGGDLTVQVSDRTGGGLTGLKVEGRLTRPATEAGHTEVLFHEIAPSQYQAHGAALHGAWDLAVTVRDSAGHTAIAERRLILP